MAVFWLVSTLCWAQPKPAAVQLCLELPVDVPLFAKTPGPQRRAIAQDAHMLDVEVRFDGETPQKLTRAGERCFRAWLPARKVRLIELDFGRLSENLVAAPRAVSLQLKSDLWFDAGTIRVEQRPFASLSVSAGEVRLERQTSAGLVRESPERLPAGRYRLTYTPPPTARGPCRVQVEVTAVGSVTPERQPALFDELKTHYERELAPGALRKLGLSCADDEVALVQTKLVDGLFVRPSEPTVTRQRVPGRGRTYLLRHEGQTRSVFEPVELTIEPGQRLELIEQARPSELATAP